MIGRALLRVTASAGAIGLGLLLAAPAHAADEINIDHVEVTDGTVSVLLGVDRMPAGSNPDLDSLEVTVNGDRVEATGERIEAGQVMRTTVLAIDASNSMSGSRIREAKTAATAFLDAAPPDVLIGLLTFSGRVGNVIPPTTDREGLVSAISGIHLTSGTRVYDAVVEAVNLAGDDGARSVLLLSDGKDQGGGVPLEEALQAATDGGVVVDVVALEQDIADRALLSRISAATGGDVVTASDSASLTSLFAAEADALAHQILVRFPQPLEQSNEVNLDVSLSAGGTTYQDSAFLSLSDGAASGPRLVHPADPLVGGQAMLAGAVALGLALALALSVVLLGGRGPTSSQHRLAAYLGEVEAPTGPGGFKDSAVAFTGTLVKGDFETRLAQRIAGAGLSLTAAEWVLLQAGVAVSGGLVGLVLGGSVLMVLLLLAGVSLPSALLKIKHGRRLAAFAAQLPETLTLIAGSLSAGLSMPQAVDTVVREGREPMASELRRALVEHRLGIDIEEAMEGVAERMGSKDFEWVVMAIRIQREVGGDLSEILNTVADTLREREYLRRQVRTLSAEGRLSAWILGGLPVTMFLYMLVANRDFIRPLYTEGLGWVMLAAAVLLLGSGSFVMSRLVKVEV